MAADDDIRRLARQALEKAATAHRKIALELFTRIVMRTPVDTGRLRGNWQPGAGVYVMEPVDSTDPGGGATIAMISQTVLGAAPFVALTLSNNLPYAGRIEYGYSKQAPAGMVRISAAEFQGIANVTIQEVAGA
jgi:hypothetical protein